jgi:cytochrome c oxidase subunit 2
MNFLKNLPLFPEQASTVAGRVDNLYFFLIAVSAFFAILIFALVTFFVIRYRRRPGHEARPIHGSISLEILWTIIPFCIAMVMFAWGAGLYFEMARPPSNATEIYVVGKQWMWKFQHPEGPREINEIHVPVGRPVKLIMTSEDVIHSLFVPAFRVKQDVLPGRYVTAWFEATRVGEYHLFCTEYCGTEHAQMIGRVVVMEPAAYEQWLAGGSTGESMAAAGAKLFQQLGCQTCHSSDSGARGPMLEGQFGHPVQLTDGRIVKVDESYVRESIVDPAGKIVAGFEPIMPTYKGLVSEEGILQLVAYIKSLSQEGNTASPGTATQPSQP